MDLIGIEKFNILIGRNNIGKSTLLSILNQIGHISVSEPYEKKITMDVEFSIFLDNVPKNIFLQIFLMVRLVIIMSMVKLY